MSTTAIAAKTQTLANLQAAYEGESNAALKYTAFAVQAEIEGLHRVASLFRAAARAEQVHAAHHARVILKMGGTPTANIHPIVVKRTRENLDAARTGENYESEVMYPDFIKEARASNSPEAVRAFELAMKAEIVHAQLYTNALNNLDAQHTATIFFVCLVCGEVTDKPEDTNQCPLCKAPKEKFIAVR